MWSFSGKQTVSQKARGAFQKSLCHALENVMTPPSVLPFLTPGCLRKWNLAGKFVIFDHACMTAPLRLLIASCYARLCCASQLILCILQL